MVRGSGEQIIAVCGADLRLCTWLCGLQCSRHISPQHTSATDHEYRYLQSIEKSLQREKVNKTVRIQINLTFSSSLASPVYLMYPLMIVRVGQ